MFNKALVVELVEFIQAYNGINNKAKLADLVKHKFTLLKDRSVFYCNDYAIRFCHSKTRNMGNTVLSLSALQKYDSIPVFVCIVTPDENHLLLANTTCLNKISHSSQQLQIDNIRGSFNGSDIMRVVSGISNEPQHFEELFLLHESFSFQENLERLVEQTNQIAPTGKRFQPNEAEIDNILNAPKRAKEFLASQEYLQLKRDLDARVKSVQREIAIAAFIDNVNIRGRVIEYLITSDGDTLKEQIIDSIQNKKTLPSFKTLDNLGDYSTQYPNFLIETEIKSKVLFLESNPKAYNIDKLLSFLSKDRSVYMIYLVGIAENGNITTALSSVFDTGLLTGTVVLSHWAGRNSRGVTQFYGKPLVEILKKPANLIDLESAHKHLMKMLST